MKKYQDLEYSENELTEDDFFKYKIIVKDEKTKVEMIEAFKHIHDSDIDTDYILVNQLAHEYEDSRNIIVGGEE